MLKLIIILILSEAFFFTTVGCTHFRQNIEIRCQRADLNIKSLKITEDFDGNPRASVVCGG
jgi:hypothetical protein